VAINCSRVMRSVEGGVVTPALLVVLGGNSGVNAGAVVVRMRVQCHAYVEMMRILCSESESGERN
jgi:hypothetical protein